MADPVWPQPAARRTARPATGSRRLSRRGRSRSALCRKRSCATGGARAPSYERRRVSYPVSDSMACIRRERVQVPCAELARRIERTDSLGDRLTVQQLTPTATRQGLISRTPHTPDCHRDHPPHAGRGPPPLPAPASTRRRRHPSARLARALRLARDLALEFRIDPDPSDAPARRLKPRVRLTRGAIHRDIVSHIRRLDRPAKHPLAGPPLGRPQPRRARRPGWRHHHDREAAALRPWRRLAFDPPVAPPPRSLAGRRTYGRQIGA